MNKFLSLLILGLLFSINNSQGSVRFRLLFDSKPFVSQAVHNFSCLNESSGHWSNCELKPAPEQGVYLRSELSPGSYVIRLDVDDNRNNPKNYPHDYHADHRFQISATNSSPSIDVPVARFIHLLKPETNDGITTGALGDDCQKKPRFIHRGFPFLKNIKAFFSWESVAPETIYKISIVRRKCEKYADLGVVKKFETTKLESIIELPASNPDEYYALFLNGFKDQKLIGEFFTYDEGMQSWSYGFRVVRETSSEYILVIGVLTILFIALWIQLKSSKQKFILRTVLCVSFSGSFLYFILNQDQYIPIEFHSPAKVSNVSSGPKQPSDSPQKSFDYVWSKVVPKPTWWESAKASYEIHSYAELMQRWQSQDSEEASRQALFRAIYEAIEKYPSDEHLVVAGMDLLFYLTNELNIKMAIGKTAQLHHLNYHQKVDNCANCSTGDTVANLMDSYATALVSSNREEEAHIILEDFLAIRENDTSAWKNVEIYMKIIRQFMAQGKLDLAKEWMKLAMSKYPNTSRDAQLKELEEELSKK